MPPSDDQIYFSPQKAFLVKETESSIAKYKSHCLLLFLCRCILANDTSKLYVASNMPLNSYETDDFYVRHMHNEECPGQFFRLPPSDDQIYFSPQKAFLIKETESSIVKYKSMFCIDNFQSEIHGLHVSGFVCQNAPYEILNKTTNGTCRDADLIKFNKRVRAAYTFCGLFSLVFLLITMFVYMTLPNLKNLHGKIVLSNVTSILFTTMLLVVIYNVRKNTPEKEEAKRNDSVEETEGEFLITVPAAVCLGLGYLLYYTGISMFCWMSVMCIDLCWTFARATIPR